MSFLPSVDYSTLKQHVETLAKARSAIKAEFPEAQVYSSEALFDIWTGVSALRVGVQRLYNDMISKSFSNKTLQDKALSGLHSYDAKFAALNTYTPILYKAKAENRVNVVLPDYFLKARLLDFLDESSLAVLNATMLPVNVAVESGVMSPILSGFSTGATYIYQGVRKVIKTAVGLAEGVIGLTSFIARNWMLIAAGGVYLWYTKDKR